MSELLDLNGRPNGGRPGPSQSRSARRPGSQHVRIGRCPARIAPRSRGAARAGRRCPRRRTRLAHPPAGGARRLGGWSRLPGQGRAACASDRPPWRAQAPAAPLRLPQSDPDQGPNASAPRSHLSRRPEGQRPRRWRRAGASQTARRDQMGGRLRRLPPGWRRSERAELGRAGEDAIVGGLAVLRIFAR